MGGICPFSPSTTSTTLIAASCKLLSITPRFLAASGSLRALVSVTSRSQVSHTVSSSALAMNQPFLRFRSRNLMTRVPRLGDWAVDLKLL